MKIVRYESAGTMTATAIGKMIFIGDNSTTDYFYMSIDTTVDSNAPDSQPETVSSFIGYRDEKAYFYNSGANLNQAFTSSMPKEEFKDYFFSTDSAAIPSTNVKSLEQTVERKGSGDGWVFTLTGFSAKTVTAYESVLHTDEILDIPVSDMIVTIVTDDKMVPNEVRINLEFAVDEHELFPPEYSYTIKYSKFNKAERIDGKFTEIKYKEIEDVRILDFVEEELTNIKYSEEGSAKLIIDQYGKRNSNEYEASTTYAVSFGGDVGSFYYDAEISGDTNSIISYKDGKKIAYGDNASSGVATEKSAREFVYSILGYISYQKNRVIDVTKTEEGLYILDLGKADETFRESICAALGFSYGDSKETMTVTVEDGSITKIECSIDINARYSSDFYNQIITLEFNRTK